MKRFVVPLLAAAALIAVEAPGGGAPRTASRVGQTALPPHRRETAAVGVHVRWWRSARPSFGGGSGRAASDAWKRAGNNASTAGNTTNTAWKTTTNAATTAASKVGGDASNTWKQAGADAGAGAQKLADNTRAAAAVVGQQQEEPIVRRGVGVRVRVRAAGVGLPLRHF